MLTGGCVVAEASLDRTKLEARLPSWKAFGEVLRKQRVEVGLSQEDVAEELGLTQSYLSKCERGLRGLELRQWLAWCVVCKVDARRFLNLLKLKRVRRRKKKPRGRPGTS